MTTTTAAQLLHLVDRAERGSLLAEEAQQLRDGIRALDAARRSAGPAQRPAVGTGSGAPAPSPSNGLAVSRTHSGP